PAAHELRCQKLLLLGNVSVLAQELAEPADVLLQAAIGHVTAVARESFGLREVGGRPSFVRVTEDEFTRFQWRAGARSRILATAFNDRLRESIAIAEMVVRIDEWRYGREVKRREHFN